MTMATSPGAAWVAAVVALGGDRSTAQSSAAELERRYAEPHRRYHTNTHIRAVLADCSWLAAELALGPRERAVLDLAACAHDVVYDANPGDDERASAEWATTALTDAEGDGDDVRRVTELILATLTHDAGENDTTAAVLLDADLAILAADPAIYDEYVVGVRAEYAAIPDDLWAAGRGHVLRSFVARPRLFITAPANEKWEDRARANLRRELEALTP